MLCRVFYYRRLCVEILKVSMLNFGGRKHMVKGVFIGANGSIYVGLKKNVVWVLGIWPNSTYLYWPKRGGEFGVIRTLK